MLWYHDGQTNGIIFYPICLSVTSTAGLRASGACTRADGTLSRDREMRVLKKTSTPGASMKNRKAFTANF